MQIEQSMRIIYVASIKSYQLFIIANEASTVDIIVTDGSQFWAQEALPLPKDVNLQVQPQGGLSHEGNFQIESPWSVTLSPAPSSTHLKCLLAASDTCHSLKMELLCTLENCQRMSTTLSDTLDDLQRRASERRDFEEDAAIKCAALVAEKIDYMNKLIVEHELEKK